MVAGTAYNRGRGGPEDGGRIVTTDRSGRNRIPVVRPGR